MDEGSIVLCDTSIEKGLPLYTLNVNNFKFISMFLISTIIRINTLEQYAVIEDIE